MMSTLQHRLTDQQRKALLSGLDIAEQITSPLLASSIEQRERLTRMNTIELDATLPCLDIAEQITSPLLASSIEQRERLTRMNTIELDAALPHTHAPLKRQQPPRAAGRMLQLALQKRWRRVPALLQMSAVDCGAACLAMILSYYGRKTSVSEVGQRCGVGRDGLSARSLVQAARDYGMRVRAISLQENDFRFVRLPAIVHWEFNHFLVVERWSANWIEVVDPALGRKRLSAEEFEAGFTGVVILLEPGAQFIRHHPAAQLSLHAYLAEYVKQAPTTLLQIVGASLLLQLFGLGIPLLTEVVVDQVIPFHMTTVMALMGIGLLILLLSQVVTTLLRAVLLLYLQARVDMHLMLGFVERLLMLPLPFFLRHSRGDLFSRLASTTVIADLLSERLLATILDGSLVTAYAVILLSQSRPFGLLVLALGSLQVIVLLSTSGPLRALARRELEAQGKSQGYVAEALSGIATLKAAGAEQRALEQWSNVLFEQVNVSMRRNGLSSLVQTAMTGIRSFCPLVLLWMGTMQVLNGVMPVGTMLALNALAMAFLTPLTSLVSSGQKLQLARSHLERVVAVVEAEPEQHVQFVHQPPKLTGRITLENVSFRYDAHSPDVLRNICVQIEAGQKVAIVGPTGSGKSTLGKLLLGLHLSTQGNIRYDGIPLRYLNYQAVRAQFGVVLQEDTIFSGSIRHNISFSDPTMSLERVMQAARLARLHEDIVRMPMGYDTFVSEAGTALSGGQRQRLALARALAHAPAILLLDEATSSLDVLTERLVEHNLKTLGCTQIIIAHRLSTIRHADVILVLEQGRLVERGSHEELLARNGFYAKLIQRQVASGEVTMR